MGYHEWIIVIPFSVLSRFEMQKLIFTWAFFLVSISIVRSDYIAAVLEYNPLYSSTPNATVEKNLEEYVRYIEQAADNSSNIIVFPEYGLTGLYSDPAPYGIQIPNVNELPNSQDFWLQKLSNAAIGNKIYVVVNLVEKAKNARNEIVYYNTNVMFDKNGKIGAKYRKKNLYAEPLLTPGNLDESQSVFSTDFGVTFGMVICYDMFFYNPSRSILVNSPITDVILSSAWYATLPFYHSLSYQLAYAQANHINLLASNLNSVAHGISGSGIYGANGTVFQYSLTGSSVSKLLISTVKNTPSDNVKQPFGFDVSPNRENMTTFSTPRAFESNLYKFQMVNLSENIEIQEKVCHGSFCCQFNLTIGYAGNSSEVYQLMAYAGPLRLMNETVPFVRICSLLACESGEPLSCGTRAVRSTARFVRIAVKGDAPVGHTDFFQPLFLTTDLLPVFNTTYVSRVDNCRTFVSLETTKDESNVLAFGIYGSEGATLNFSYLVLVVMAVVTQLVH